MSRGSQPQMGSRFSKFQKKIRSSAKKRCTQSSGQLSGSYCGCLSSETTSSTPVKELSRSLVNRQGVDFDNLIHLLKYVNQTRDYVYVMEPQLPTADSQGFIPAEIVSFSDSGWARCQRSRRSTSGSLITLYSVNLSSTSRTQASVSHSSAEAELYAMTQASVDSLAIKRFIKELKSEILSRDVKITLKTDSSAGKTMASRLGISKRSKHIELKRLWIQDVLSEGVMSLEKVGTHNNPSDILTKFIQASVLAIIFPSSTSSEIRHCLRCSRLALLFVFMVFRVIEEVTQKIKD